jgi:hypothetical protein
MSCPKNKNMKYLIYSAILGFGLWMGSEIIEIIQGGYSPEVYYLTAGYHFFAGLGVWGLYKKQTRGKNTFNTISALIASVSYLVLTFFPIQVMNSGLSMSAFLEQNPLYKLGGGVWFIGMLLFGISVVKTSHFPKWSGIMILLGTVIFTATNMFGWPSIVVNVSNIVFSISVIYISIKSLKNS